MKIEKLLLTLADVSASQKDRDDAAKKIAEGLNELESRLSKLESGADPGKRPPANKPLAERLSGELQAVLVSLLDEENVGSVDDIHSRTSIHRQKVRLVLSELKAKGFVDSLNVGERQAWVLRDPGRNWLSENGFI